MNFVLVLYVIKNDVRSTVFKGCASMKLGYIYIYIYICIYIYMYIIYIYIHIYILYYI